MRIIHIGDQTLGIKDYDCSQGERYIQKNDGKLWLYVNITDVCHGRCPFCVNPGRKTGVTPFDLDHFKYVLGEIKGFVYGVSFTGGEPLLESRLLDEAVMETSAVMGDSVEIDLVTSGVNLEEILSLKCLDDLTSIHISRHCIADDDNKKLMGFGVPSAEEIKSLIRELEDPGKVVLNCMLRKDGVRDISQMADYLNAAAQIGVRNVSFIGLIKANQYCKEQYVDPAKINFDLDQRFRIWNRFHDHDYCSCSSGDFKAEDRWIRFYYRAPGISASAYVRQLVYTAENKLLSGFGGREIGF